MATTLLDIAREASVDVSTVSRALNGRTGVKQEIRQRILDVAARLNYRPNLVARGLVTGKSNVIGLLVSDIRNPFSTEIARGAEDAAYEAGYDVVLCNSDLDPVKQMRYFRSLVDKRAGGIVTNSVARLRVQVILRWRTWVKFALQEAGLVKISKHPGRELTTFLEFHLEKFQRAHEPSARSHHFRRSDSESSN